MATPVTNVQCGVCKQQDLNETAEFWCPQCDEGLCNTCKKFHEFLKTSRHHKVISIADYQSLPISFLAGKQTCVEHDLQLDLYCKKHQQLCCSACLKGTHANCEGREIDAFDNVVKNIKSSAKLESIENNVSDLKSDLELVVTYCSETIAQVGSQMNFCRNELKCARKKLNDHLDMLDIELEKSIDSEESQAKTKLESVMKTTKTKLDNVKRLHDNLDVLKVHSTDHQTYHGMHGIEKELLEVVSYLEIVVKSGDLSKPNFSINFSNVEKGIELLSNLGTTKNEPVPFEYTLDALKKKDVQQQVIERRPKVIGDFKLKLKHKFSLSAALRGSLDAGVIKPSGDLLLISYDKKQLMSCKNNGGDLRQLTYFSNEPIDVALDTDTNSAIVGFLNETEGIRVDLDTLKPKVLHYQCYGVDCHKGYLFASVPSSNTFSRINLKTSEQKIVKLDSSCYSCKAMDDYFLCSFFHDNTVAAYDYEGKQIWKFKDKNLCEPFGVASTIDNFIFVACGKSNNVMLISPDGQNGRVLLNETDGIKHPRGIHYNNDRKELLVINEKTAEVFLYDVGW